MQHLRTERLYLIPCSLDAAESLVSCNAVSEYKRADNWPSEDIKGFLPHYIKLLECDPLLLGWGVWLMVHDLQQKIIGDLGFKGRPDTNGVVDIGYSIAPEYRRQEYTFEATKSLVSWAFGQNTVNKIIAECTRDNTPSIRLLKKLGMRPIHSTHGMLKWELGRVSGE